ncbi:MAG: pyridoxal 5'-phosphate synthase glutaminase subunit PdxT [Thermoproteota archaeon]|nr:pyridoxal 5'-phosphate synthase glutaminase subunit PdxT [Thermoproteota archaeon]
MTIGVLGLQGDIEENVAVTSQALQGLHINGSVDIVRYPEELEKIDGLILPGGESTVQSTLAAIQRSLPVLKKRISEGMPVLGTCAGMIMLSKRAYDRVIGDTKQKLIGNLDIVIERNAFGRQNDSFEADLSLAILGKEPFKGVFIRAPAVSEVGKDVEVIGKLNNRIVAVKHKNIIGTAFHPELSGDSRMHEQLINMVLEFKNKNGS